MKNENTLYHISLFPNNNYQNDNILNFPSSQNVTVEKSLKNKIPDIQKEEKKEIQKKTSKNQRKQKRKKKVKNNLNKKNIIESKRNKDINYQFLNQSSDTYKEYNNQNIFENKLVNERNKKENDYLTLFYQKKNSPMINGNEIYNVNKNNNELIGKNLMNLPYNNIGALNNKINKQNINISNTIKNQEKNI